jgi:hypothetical protein
MIERSMGFHVRWKSAKSSDDEKATTNFGLQ